MGQAGREQDVSGDAYPSRPPQLRVCSQAGLRAYERTDCRFQVTGFPRRGAVADWLPFSQLPLRGQRRNGTDFPFHPCQNGSRTPENSGARLTTPHTAVNDIRHLLSP